MYDIYKLYRKEGQQEVNAYITIDISVSSDDKYEIFKLGDFSTRLEVLSEKYYGEPQLYKFILMANGYISEYDIPDEAILRIPFPLQRVKLEYENKVKLNIKL